MTKDDADRAALDYFDGVNARLNAERLERMRASDEPWVQGQYDLWVHVYANEIDRDHDEKR